MSEALNDLGAHLEAKRPDCVTGWEIAFGELTVTVTPEASVVRNSDVVMLPDVSRWSSWPAAKPVMTRSVRLAPSPVGAAVGALEVT